MSIQKYIVPALVITVVGGGVAVAVYFSGNATSNEVSRDTAPTFTLENYAGEEVSLEDSEGTIRVINMWATWCPFCTDELPDFALLQETYPEEVTVIAINRQESRQKAKAFTDKIGVTEDMTFLLDPKDSYYKKIGGFAMPETLFLNSDNEIVTHKRGPMDIEQMQQQVRRMLEGQ